MAAVSSVVRPVGPQPPGVYWRRRLLLALAVLAVLALLWLLLRPGSSSGGTAAPSRSPSATAPTSASPKPSPTKTTASPSASTSSSPTSTGVQPCTASVIGVKIATDKPSYPVGTPVKLTMRITNAGTVSCLRDVGAKANTVLITSGGQPVWSSDDCNPGGEPNVVTMKPGESYEVSLTWNGAVTQGSCPSNPTAAKAGAYDAVGKNGDANSSAARFALT